METGSRRLTAAAEDYFTALRRIRASGGATGERSSYAPLAALLDAVGATLKPPLPFPELEEDRDRAGRVKRETPVLVVLRRTTSRMSGPHYIDFA